MRYCKVKCIVEIWNFHLNSYELPHGCENTVLLFDPRSDDNCTKRFTQDMEETTVVRTDIDANCNSDNVVDDVANKDADFTVVNTDEMVRPQLPVNLMEEK